MLYCQVQYYDKWSANSIYNFPQQKSRDIVIAMFPYTFEDMGFYFASCWKKFLHPKKNSSNLNDFAIGGRDILADYRDNNVQVLSLHQ